MKKILVVLLFLMTASFLFSEDFDARVSIGQSALNKFLGAIGPLTYKSSYEEKKLGFNMDYSWTVQSPAIQIHPNQAVFQADVSVAVGPVKKGSFTILKDPFKYPTKATGVVEVKYDEVSNIISVKVLKVSFEVAVTVLGSKIHITDVDISQYYKPEFQFSGPQPIQKSIDVKMPDGKVKTFLITAKPRMTLEEAQIVVSSPVEFTVKP